MEELADSDVSKASARKGVRVRIPLPARLPQVIKLSKMSVVYVPIGMPSNPVAEGWDHFLASLSGYLEHGTGAPFGA